jgi:hypothetical protein
MFNECQDESLIVNPVTGPIGNREDCIRFGYPVSRFDQLMKTYHNQTKVLLIVNNTIKDPRKLKIVKARGFCLV